MKTASRLPRRTHPRVLVPPSRLCRFLAWCEPILAVLYWPCLKAKSLLEDRTANLGGASR